MHNKKLKKKIILFYLQKIWLKVNIWKFAW